MSKRTPSVVEACLYNIQEIGEAVNQLPEDVKIANPHIPWTLIKGMRNRLIHEYFGTDLPLVWNTIKNDLPGFGNGLKAIQIQLEKRKSINWPIQEINVNTLTSYAMA
jgi:uncharacterized protein with HEPN domain